jgi:CRISPR-associated protein (TIGR02584 family)
MKNILLAVVGTTPQVITETLYALHKEGRQVDAIYVITTRMGKETINAHLLPARDGQFRRYLREYNIDPRTIAFDSDHIYTITDENGIEIDDIAGAEENERLLKACLDLTFHLTKEKDSTVYFSIAGGRKTMSASLMVAAQFYGRQQDRVYHVLVSPEYESNRDFFYPPVESRPITLIDENGHPYLKETRYADITLVPIPFVSVRDNLSRGMLQEPSDPATLMLSLVREEPPHLVIDLPAFKVTYKKLELDMMPSRMALYAFFALQKKQCQKDRQSCRGCVDCYLTVAEILERQEEIADYYKKMTLQRDFTAMSDSGILALNAENFNSYKSRIRSDLQKAFGRAALREIAIESEGTRPDTRYGLRIDRKRIRLVL